MLFITQEEREAITALLEKMREGVKTLKE